MFMIAIRLQMELLMLIFVLYAFGKGVDCEYIYNVYEFEHFSSMKLNRTTTFEHSNRNLNVMGLIDVRNLNDYDNIFVEKSMLEKKASNDEINIVLAVLNSKELKLLYIAGNKIFKEILIKAYDEIIIKVDVKWLHNRIYVLTNSNDLKVRLYEIHLHTGFMQQLLFEQKLEEIASSIHLTSSPLKGFVAFLLDKHLYFTKTFFNVDRLEKTPQPNNTIKCKVDGKQVNFIVADLSHFDFNTKTMRVYAYIDENEMNICSYFNNNNSFVCWAPDDKNKNILQNAYSQFQKNNNTERKFYIPPLLSKSIYNNMTPEKCSRILNIQNILYAHCTTQAKTELCAGIPKSVTNGQLTISNETTDLSIDYYNPILNLCINIQEFIVFDLDYKYIIYKKAIQSINDIVFEISKDYDNKTIHSMNFTFYLEFYFPSVKSELNLIEIYMQAPFERPKRIETFLLNTTNMKYTKSYNIPNKPRISDLVYFFEIHHNSVQAMITFPGRISLAENQKQYYNYILIDTTTNKTRIVNLNETEVVLRPIQEKTILSFSISNLTENTMYKIRMFHSVTNEFYSLSNLVTFSTLKTPKIELVNVNSNNASLKVNVKCDCILVNHDMQNGIIVLNNQICGKIKYRWRLNNTNETMWVENHDELDISFNSKKFRNNNDGSDSVHEINIGDLTENSEYEYSVKVSYNHNNSYSWSMDSPGTFKTLVKPLVVPDNPNSVKNKHVLQHESILTWPIILGSVILGISIIGLIALFIGRRLWRKRQRLREHIALMSANHLYEDGFFKNLNLIKKDQLEYNEKLGSGAFGDVFKGKLKTKNEEKVVALKTFRKINNKNLEIDVLKEALISMHLKHKNLLEFYGICFHLRSPKCLVIEYADLGDLLGYVRKFRYTQTFNYKMAIELCKDVADACEFLEQNKIVHRDIACRNCLVKTVTDAKENERKVIVKLGDFGLARELYASDCYKMEILKPLPIRWLSPESLLDQVSTSKSDVWAYGILVLEVITMGNQPYPGLENQEVVKFVQERGIPEIPPKCPDELRELMLNCWKFESTQRPTFEMIVVTLNKINNETDEIKCTEYTSVVHSNIYTSL